MTDGKRSDEVLGKADEWYQSLIESSPDMITVLDAEGTIRFASPATQHLGGYRPEELVGQNAYSYVHPADVPLLKARLDEIRGADTTAPPVLFRFRLRHRDGTWRVFEAVARRRFEDPQIAGFVINARDITQVRHAEESVPKLLLAVEQAPSVITMTDAAGSITYVNPAFEKAYGYSKEDVLGKTPRILKSGRHDRAFYELLEETPYRRVRAGRVRQQDTRPATRHRGGFRQFRRGLHGEANRLHRRAGRRDRAQSHQKGVAQSERKFALTFRANPIPASISEMETGRILDANEQFLSILGSSRPELIGRTASELQIWQDGNQRQRMLRRVRETGEARNVDTRIRTRSGEIRTVIGSVVRIDVGSMPCLLSTFLDVAERLRAEADIRASEERYRLLFDNNPQPMWAFDEETLALLAVNDAACHHYGYTREEFLGMRITDIRPAEDAPPSARTSGSHSVGLSASRGGGIA